MHPFGGTPVCPRCSKMVYAAEQVMGPGRKLYHKPCLSCASCNKRLDSLSLVEHDDEPYCKQCHVKEFGTKDLRQANLPQAPRPVSPTQASPTKRNTPFQDRDFSRFSKEIVGSSSQPGAGNDQRIASMAVRPLSPVRPSGQVTAQYNAPTIPEWDEEDKPDATLHTSQQGGLVEGTLGVNGKTTPETPKKDGQTTTWRPPTTPTMKAVLTGTQSSPIKANATGGWTPRRMAGATSAPLCPKCGKTVYFAEQVQASGRTWHRPCLRCSECNTPLDSMKLAEREGKVVCRSCYSKLYGPQGSGYALLGKAGG